MAQINKILIDNIDYDIVSESAEKKIAELEKNNAALASIEFGARDDLQNPVKVGLGRQPVNFGTETDIYIGRGTSIGDRVMIGTTGPVKMDWITSNTFCISNGDLQEITISSDAIRFNKTVIGESGGSSSISGVDMRDGMRILTSEDGLCFGTEITNVLDRGYIQRQMQISMYDYDTLSIANPGNNFLLRISSSMVECNGNNLLASAGSGDSSGSSSGSDGIVDLPVESLDGTILYLGTGDFSMVAENSKGRALMIGTDIHIGHHVNIGSYVAIGTYSPDYLAVPKIQIGTELQDGFLGIRGPVYIETELESKSVTIGNNFCGVINIDWVEDDKIVFTNLNSGKKATLTLS